MITTRRGSAYTTGLGFLIVLVIMAVLFAYLTWDRYNIAQAIRYGDPEATELRFTEAESLNRRYDEQVRVENEIRAEQERVNLRRNTLARLDNQLAARGIFFDRHGNLIRGDREDPTPWEATASDVTHMVTFTDQVARNYEQRVQHRFAELRTVINQLRSSIADVNRDAGRADDRFERTRNELLDTLDRLERQYNADLEQYHNDFSELRTRETQLDQRIRELLELRLRWLEELRPVGRIVTTGVNSNFVVINIGRKDRVQRGMRFEVFRHVQGQYTTKGMLEVTDLEETQATCRIIEVVDQRRLPISNGDLIGNPAFDTQRPVRFYLAGEFSQLNKSDVKHFIEQMGSIATIVSSPDEIAPGYDFLVAGGRSDPFQDKAREFQMIAIREEHMVRYLQPVFRPIERR